MTIVITGGNTGLGLETARALLRSAPDVRLLLACRDEMSAMQAARELDTRRVGVVRCDLASLASVNEAADEIVRLTTAGGFPPLRAVVCNAGLSVPGPMRRSADGYELTWAVNHLAHLALVRRLLPHLRAPGRVVFVASGTHDPKERTGMPAPRLETTYLLAHSPSEESSAIAWGGRRYTTSKLCNVMTAYELDRRLKRDGPAGVTANAYDPGFMPMTGLLRNVPAGLRFVMRGVVPALGPLLRLMGFRMSTPERSGAFLARLAADPAFDGVSGRYFATDHEKRSSDESYDQAKAARLWDESVELIEGRPLQAAA